MQANQKCVTPGQRREPCRRNQNRHKRGLSLACATTAQLEAQTFICPETTQPRPVSHAGHGFPWTSTLHRELRTNNTEQPVTPDLLVGDSQLARKRPPGANRPPRTLGSLWCLKHRGGPLWGRKSSTARPMTVTSGNQGLSASMTSLSASAAASDPRPVPQLLGGAWHG